MARGLTTGSLQCSLICIYAKLLKQKASNMMVYICLVCKYSNTNRQVCVDEAHALYWF